MHLRLRTTKGLFFSFCLIVLEHSAEPALEARTHKFYFIYGIYSISSPRVHVLYTQTVLKTDFHWRPAYSTCIHLYMYMDCTVLNVYVWAGSALRSRTVRQKEKKRSFVVLKRRSIHKSCPRTHNPVLFL